MTMAEDVQRAKWQRVRATNATPMYEQWTAGGGRQGTLSWERAGQGGQALW